MTTVSESITVEGRRLHVQRWPLAPGRPALGTVQLVHGLGEHMGRYAALAEVLNAAGWHVRGHDHWGHGRSDGPRGGLPEGDTLLRDLAAVHDLQPSDGRVILLGHSLGGLVAARFVAETLVAQPADWARGVDGLVLSSPALDLGLTAWHRGLLALLLPLLPRLPLNNGLKSAWICNDPQVVRNYVQDPLVHTRITPRLLRFMLDAADVVQARAPLWRVSTLLQWAGADRCVSPAGSLAFAAAVPAGVLQSQPLAGFAHEIYNEPGREQALARLRRWLGGFETAQRGARLSA